MSADGRPPGAASLGLVRSDGSETAVGAREGETVLEAAERAGEPLPFGCRTGACGTCTARLLDGAVCHERPPRALKRRQLEAGYVLACVAVPRGDCRLRVGSDVLAETKPHPWKRPGTRRIGRPNATDGPRLAPNMTDDTDLNDYLILRALDDPITREELDAAAEASGEALSALREEGVGIRWVDSEVLTDDEGRVTGTYCHYRAESEDALHEHGERAGLPVTRVDRRGTPLDGE